MSFYEHSETRYSNLVVAKTARSAELRCQAAALAGIGAFVVNTERYRGDWLRAYRLTLEEADPVSMMSGRREERMADAERTLIGGGAIVHLMTEPRAGESVDDQLAAYQGYVDVLGTLADQCGERL